MRDFRLYIILDEATCRSRGLDIVQVARKTLEAGADILQLRAKDLPDKQILKIGRAIKRLTQKHRALFLLNDRAELAPILNIDGVHLGQEDLPLKDARKLLGRVKIIGLSTHSLEQAVAAERQGADYIGVGPVFPTATKPQLRPLGTQLIRQIKDEVNIPLVAIGGIDLGNLNQVLNAGAQRVAICRAIITAEDISAATRQFRAQLND